MRKYDVIGLGISAVDDLLFVAGRPSSDCKAQVLGRRRCGGGPACTAAAAVGSLGGAAAFLGKLGSDQESQFIRAELSSHGVDISHIIPVDGAAPYRSAIVVNEAGERAIFYDPSSYQRLTMDELPTDTLSSARVLLIDYLGGVPPLDVVMSARSAGVDIVGDIEGRFAEATELAASVDYLVVPEDFALWSTGVDDANEACAKLAKSPRKATIVTCGARGGYFSVAGSNEVRHFTAFHVETSDTTGCGDVFHGAFALAIARQAAVEQAIRFASAAAALKANAKNGTVSGWDALPSLEEIETFFDDPKNRRQADAQLSEITGSAEIA